MKFFYSAFLVLFTLTLQAQSSLTFSRMEGAVLYVDHQGGPLSFTLEASYKPQKRAYGVTPGLLATLYDPEEKAVKDFYWRDTDGSTEKVFTYSVKNAPKRHLASSHCTV